MLNLNLDLIKDLLEWHSYIYPNNDISWDDTEKFHTIFEEKYCGLKNKDIVLNRYYYLLKRYGFLDGIPPSDSIITNSGQEFYDLLNCELLKEYITLFKPKLEMIPLSNIFNILKDNLNKKILLFMKKDN